MQVLIENLSFDNRYFIGRTMQDVPDIDGLVYIKNVNQNYGVNSFVDCEIVDVDNYDLIAQ